MSNFEVLKLFQKSSKFKFKPSPPHHSHPPNPPHPPTPIHAPRLNRDYKRWYTLRINNYCIIKDFSVPSLARSVPKPLKVPSLARSVPKPLKIPSLARSVAKPLKVPSLARSVPKPLLIELREAGGHQPGTYEPLLIFAADLLLSWLWKWVSEWVSESEWKVNDPFLVLYFSSNLYIL